MIDKCKYCGDITECQSIEIKKTVFKRIKESICFWCWYIQKKNEVKNEREANSTAIKSVKKHYKQSIKIKSGI